MTRCCCLAEAVELEEVGVGAHGGVEADQCRATRRLAAVASASTEQHADTTRSMSARSRPSTWARPASISGRIRSLEEGRRAQLVADPAVADLAGEPGHGRAHRGQVDRDLGALHRVGALVAADPHRLVLALEVIALAGRAASRDEVRTLRTVSRRWPTGLPHRALCQSSLSRCTPVPSPRMKRPPESSSRSSASSAVTIGLRVNASAMAVPTCGGRGGLGDAPRR